VRDLPGRLRKQWPTPAYVSAAQQIGVPDQGADRQTVLLGAQTVESFDAIDVHNDSGAKDAQVEHGHQALATGQHSALLPGIVQNVQGLLEVTWHAVVEPGWLQR
jgi:hypothetical protein